LKLTQRTIEKAILILQWVNLCFQNRRQSNDCIYWMACVWSLTKEVWFSKYLKKHLHLFDFISTIRLEKTWSLTCESWFQKKKDCQTRRTSIKFAKSWTKMTLSLLDHPLKVEHLRAIHWTMERKLNNI
jgi:hypothetical protein